MVLKDSFWLRKGKMLFVRSSSRDLLLNRVQ
jgi:hypothetical protein